MVVKNKLYKHHKSKFVLTIRNISIYFLSLGVLVVLAAIPTYINTKPVSSADADTHEVVKSQNDDNQTEEVETIQEEN